jgi:predicted nucleic acid-binding protein
VIIADTTIWIDHLRSRDPTLERLMEGIEVLMHPFILGELMLGSIADRTDRLREWRDLPKAKVLRHEDVQLLIETHRLYSRGIGYTDANLLVTAMSSDGVQLWTRDKRLSRLAVEMDVAARLDH